MLCMKVDTSVQLAAMRRTPSRDILGTVNKQRCLVDTCLPSTHLCQTGGGSSERRVPGPTRPCELTRSRFTS